MWEWRGAGGASSYLPFRNASEMSASSITIRGGSRFPTELEADNVNARTAGGRRKRRRGRASIATITPGRWMWYRYSRAVESKLAGKV